MLQSIPKWFWITLGVIIIFTIASISACKRQKVDEVQSSQEKLTVGATTPEAQAQEKQNVFSIVSGITDAMNP